MKRTELSRPGTNMLATNRFWRLRRCAGVVLLIFAGASQAETRPDKVAVTGGWRTSPAVSPVEHVRTQTAGSQINTGVASGDTVRVVVRSYETASIGAELNARITHLPRREGDRFQKGDLIVEFDCRKINAEHQGAVASYKAHLASYENQRQMQRYKAAGGLSVDQARFEMEKAEADVLGLDARRASCKIFAPFDGRVIEKAAQVHEIAQPNQPIIKIINESKLELVLMVPSGWLARVAEGTAFQVRIDESGEVHDARIVQSTGLIDPVSQSARLIAELVKPAATVVPGMSGSAVFPRRKDTK
jgi:membrane fusion protein, multidrug efflux system